MSVWEKLKSAGIERPWHIDDVRRFLGVDLSREAVYTPEFQANFIANLHYCDNHPYRYVWHSTSVSDCPKCNQQEVK